MHCSQNYCITNLNKKQLNNLESWQTKFPNNEIDIFSLPYHPSWEPMFEILKNSSQTIAVNSLLKKVFENNPNALMYPKPDLLWNAFVLTPFDKVRVVFIGQDPYFHQLQAMGLSFSVPYDTAIPSSLQNILSNGKKNGHIKYEITHGNLEFWAMQGCLMINTALTVLDNQKNCHSNIWNWTTNRIIKYLSFSCSNLIFVLWGKPAFEKLNYIDQDKHSVIISSHPSGLSVNKEMQGYPAFDKCDHFGEINKILKKRNETEILWQL